MEIHYPPKQPVSLGDYLTMLQAYLHKTIEMWVSTSSNEPILYMIRRMADIAVEAMEQHGAPHRDINETPSYKQKQKSSGVKAMDESANKAESTPEQDLHNALTNPPADTIEKAEEVRDSGDVAGD